SPLQLAKLPDFNLDEEDTEPMVRNNFRVSQFYTDNNQAPAANDDDVDKDALEPQAYEQPQIASSSSDQMMKVAMLPPTRPAAICARRQQKNQYNYIPQHHTRHLNNAMEVNTPIQTRTSAVYDGRAEDRNSGAFNSNQSLIGSYYSGSGGSQTYLNT